jgi:hypothetical protein
MHLFGCGRYAQVFIAEQDERRVEFASFMRNHSTSLAGEALRTPVGHRERS